jgi:hypothetical protein
MQVRMYHWKIQQSASLVERILCLHAMPLNSVPARLGGYPCCDKRPRLVVACWIIACEVCTAWTRLMLLLRQTSTPRQCQSVPQLVNLLLLGHGSHRTDIASNCLILKDSNLIWKDDKRRSLVEGSLSSRHCLLNSVFWWLGGYPCCDEMPSPCWDTVVRELILPS